MEALHCFMCGIYCGGSALLLWMIANAIRDV